MQYTALVWVLFIQVTQGVELLAQPAYTKQLLALEIIDITMLKYCHIGVQWNTSVLYTFGPKGVQIKDVSSLITLKWGDWDICRGLAFKGLEIEKFHCIPQQSQAHFREREDSCKVGLGHKIIVLSRSHRHNYGLRYAVKVTYCKLVVLLYLPLPFCALHVLQVKKEEDAFTNYSICLAYITQTKVYLSMLLGG